MWRSAVQVCLGLLVSQVISYLSPLTSYLYFGGLAQLARAPALQAGGQRFESVILHHPVLTKFCIMHYELCIDIAHTFSCKLRVVIKHSVFNLKSLLTVLCVNMSKIPVKVKVMSEK